MQDQRLEYVCRLVRRARQPYCPINGILTLLPYGMIYRSEPDSSEIHRAVSKDLGTIRSMLKVRCPVTAAVVGLEEERGFRELMRRVGSERPAAANRALVHGLKSAAIRTARSPGSPCLRGVRRRCLQPVQRARCACKSPAIPGSLRLLCTIRSRVQNRFGQDPQAGLCQRLRSARAARRLAVRRLLLRRDGRGEDRRAFIKAVVDKLLEQQEELKWTPEMLREDARCQLFAQLALVFDTLLLAGLIGVVMYRIWWK